MAVLLFFVLIQLAWNYGQVQSERNGAASFAYADSSGRQATGTYNRNNGRVVSSGDFPPQFFEPAFPGYGYGFDYGTQDNLYPTYFLNLQRLLQEAFHSNLENQALAYNAAQKAFDLSSNQAGYYPYFATRFNDFDSFGGFERGYIPFMENPIGKMPNFANSAFASSALGPGYKSQMAALNPQNPNSPNVNVNAARGFTDTPRKGNYYSVSSNSYSSSANVNGQEIKKQGATSVIDDNGVVTSYSVHNP